MTLPSREVLELNGAPVEMFRGGSGSPLLYLHSAAGEGWLPFHDLLARRFEVLVPSHPGFRASEGLEAIDSVEDYVFHYLDLLDRLGLASVDVFGMSLGGWLAAELATRNPERVRRLVLAAAVGIAIPDFTPDFEFFQDPLMNPGYASELRRRTFHDPDAPAAHGFIPDVMPPDDILNFLRARQATARIAWNPYFHNPKLLGRLRRVKSPTLVLWGESDGLVPVVFAHAFHKAIPGSQLLVLDKCGHMMPVECPERVAAAVTEFLT